MTINEAIRPFQVRALASCFGVMLSSTACVAGVLSAESMPPVRSIALSSDAAWDLRSFPNVEFSKNFQLRLPAVKEAVEAKKDIGEAPTPTTAPVVIPTPDTSVGGDSAEKANSDVAHETLNPIVRDHLNNEPEVILPEYDIATRRLEEISVTEARHALLQSLEDGDATIEDELVYAEVLLTNLFVKEAKSVLRHVLTISPDEIQATALLRAANILDPAVDLGEPDKFQWVEGSAWQFMEMSKTRSVRDPDLIRSAAADLARQSSAVAGEITPKLFESALDINEIKLAEAILEAALRSSDLAGTPEFLLMQGQLAKARGNEQIAFDLFVGAVEMDGVVGVRAALELAEIATDSNNRAALPKALDILTEAEKKWRGGDVGLDLLAKMAEISEEIPAIPVALEVMSRIRTEFPDDAEARLAKIRMPILATKMEETLIAESTPLDQVITLTRRLGRVMSPFEEWPPLRLALARRLAAAGLNEAAIAEFQALHGDAQRLGSVYELEKSVYLEETKLLLESGRIEEARAALAAMPNLTSASQQRWRLLLRMKARDPDILDEASAILAGFRSDAEVMIALSDFALNADNDALLIATVEAMPEGSAKIPFPIEASYIRAVAEAGKGSSIELTELAKSRNLQDLGQAISEPMPTISPLSAETAKEVIDKASPVIEWNSGK